MHKLILRNFQAVGDILMLTAAIRDIHRSYPGEFVTDVRTSCKELWYNNGNITEIPDDEIAVRNIVCRYPLIQHSNKWPYHFIHGFIHFLNKELKLAIRPWEFKGDIHLSFEERDAPSIAEKTLGEDLPYWLVAAGGKFDFTIKWWDLARYQEVVDHFRERILFVQVGKSAHHHPPLRNVLDLRGKSSLRELVLLTHHASGVLCPVTGLMHMAAAVPVKTGMPPHRPCVVVAGGREPPHWEAYPHHQFIHTVGMLPCCANGGCWRSRTVALGDGDKKDRPERLCKDVVNEKLPRCMDMITPEDVIRRIEGYYRGGVLPSLNPHQASLVRSAGIWN